MNRFLITAAILVASAAAQANPTLEKNGVLTSKDGRTLYTFDKDSSGKSNCNGGCAVAWPAFVVANPAAAGGDFSIVRRDDGVQQWAYKGMPLYLFAGDAKAGDVNGDKQGGVWHALRSEKTSAAPASKTASGYDYSNAY